VIDTADIPATAQIAIGAIPASQRAPVSFDYGSLDPAHANEAREAAAHIRARLQQSQIEPGADLIKIKDMIGHGKFGAWVKAEFNFTERTAENFMNAARLAQEYEIISDLPPTMVYLLAAPSAPLTIVADVLADAKRGLIPPVREIKSRFAEAAKMKRQADIEAAKSPEQVKKDRAQEKRRLATEKTGDEKWKAEEAAREAQALARAHPVASFLFEHLGARGVRALFNMSPDWCRVRTHFQISAGKKYGWSEPILSEAEIEAKFGGAIATNRVIDSVTDELLLVH
jgi:hypothetical protein